MEHAAFSLDEDTVRAMKILGCPDIGEDRLTVSELLEQVQGMLSDQERWIFRDYLVEGLTVSEIAQQRNLHTGTVKAAIRAIRQKAKKLIRAKPFAWMSYLIR